MTTDRPAQRHGDAAVARDAARHGRGRGRRRRPRRRPDRHRPAGLRRRAVRQRGRALHAVGHQSNQVALHAQTTRRRRDLPARQGPHRRKRAGRRASALGPADAHLRLADGTLDLELLEHYFHSDDDVHHPRTTLVASRTRTTTAAAWSTRSTRCRELRAFCDRHGMILHLDGARICQRGGRLGRGAARDRRAVRLGERLPVEGPRRPGRLGAARRAATIARAQRARKLFGGGMRQAGIIAAGGLYALRHNVARLADDHRRGRGLGERLAARAGARRRPRQAADQHGLRRHPRRGLPAARVVELLDARACWPWTRRPGRCASSRTSTSTTRASSRRSPA